MSKDDLETPEKLAETHRTIARIQQVLELRCSEFTFTKLKQPIETFISVEHYLNVHGHSVGNLLPFPTGRIHNGVGYVHIPSCSSFQFPYVVSWGSRLRDIIDEIHLHASKIVFDFRGCNGGRNYGFELGFSSLLAGSHHREENKSSGEAQTHNITANGSIVSFDDGSLFERIYWPAAKPLEFSEIIVLVDGKSASNGEFIPRLLELRGAKVYGTRTMGCMSSIGYDDHVKLLRVEELQFSNNILIDGNIIKPLEPVEDVPADIWG